MGSIIIFTVEITLRIYTADLLPRYRRLPPWKARLKYLISPMSLIDLIAVVPPFTSLSCRSICGSSGLCESPGSLKFFKYHRYTSSFDIIRKVCLDRLHQLLVSTLLLLMVIVIASVLIYPPRARRPAGRFQQRFLGSVVDRRLPDQHRPRRNLPDYDWRAIAESADFDAGHRPGRRPDRDYLGRFHRAHRQAAPGPSTGQLLPPVRVRAQPTDRPQLTGPRASQAGAWTGS